MQPRNTQKASDSLSRRIGLVTTRNIARCSFAVAFVVCLASISFCCSIPVFRYALEHWRPELFIVHVISSTPLDSSQKSLLNELEKSSGFANVRWQVSDGTNLSSDELKAIVEKAKTEQSVWLAVEPTKKVDGSMQVVWDGPFTKDAVAKLLNSPCRDRICQGLADKDSVSWVFLESGVRAVDDAKFAKLESELRRLESVIKLPVIEEADLKDLSKRPDELKIKFSAHRLSRTDPSEAAFISMLLATESDLREEFENGTPMAFPVFGRGRVLFALLGDGIATSTIEEASRFLAGACQCTVKADNPGVDLLVAFDWDAHVQITAPKKGEELPLTGLGSFANQSTGARSTILADHSEKPELIEESSATANTLETPIWRSLVTSEVHVSTAELPKTQSLPWLTLVVLTAIVGVITVGWMFLAGAK